MAGECQIGTQTMNTTERRKKSENHRQQGHEAKLTEELSKNTLTIRTQGEG